MAYSLEIHGRVLDYFRAQGGLSRTARVKVFAALHDHLRNHGDFYRDNADFRLSPGSQHFWYEYALLDADGGGRGYLFRFVVSDAAA